MLIAVFALLAGPLAAAHAEDRYLDVRRGEFKPVSIAVTGFAGDAAAGAQATSIITNNFSRSAFLAPVDAKTFVDQISNPDVAPNMDSWRALNAQFVVTGRSGRSADGRLQTEFRLWDVATGQQVAGQQYVTDPNNSRRVAHIISDAIFTRITGGGRFLRYARRLRRRDRAARASPQAPRHHGSGRRQCALLTRGDDLVVTPRFSPSSQDVTYMSFGPTDPKVLLLNIETGQREVVGNFPGMTFAPRFSPDGQKIVMSLAEGAATNLFAMDIRSRTTTRLTDSSAIDTSPSYSPDGGQIAFESDRGGSQQLYVMPAGGGAPKRISFGEGRYSTPVWSPKGDLIAFTKQKADTFAIGVMRPDGSGERILTEGFHNEGPTWAPNGLYLMFFRDPGGSGGSKIYMIDVFGRTESLVPTPDFASDPTWSALLN